LSEALTHRFLERAAQAGPTSILVTDLGRKVSYGDIEQAANRIARVILDQGVARGDSLALLSVNSPAYIEAYYGILKAGAIAVPLNAQADVRSHEALLRDCTPKGLICGPRQVRVARQLGHLPDMQFLLSLEQNFPEGEALPSRLLNGPEILPGLSAEPPGTKLTAMDRSAIVYTSGSTGKPRGAILRHGNLVSNSQSIVKYLDLTSSDSVLVVLPFHYVYGKSLLNTHVAVGGSVILENRFMFPQEALNTLEREEATGLSGVPSTFAILLNKSNFASRELPNLRYVTQAGGAMAPDLQRRLMEALPGKRIFIMYGATEASARLSYLPPEDLPGKIGSIGKAIPGVELRVLRDDGSEAVTDEVGELVARGPNIMEGYWNAPEETAAVLTSHGYQTGDLCRRDEEGFLFLVGRKREMIKSGAHRISPKEIEELLIENQAVHEAAVIGAPDEMLGEMIIAFVTLRPGRAGTPDSILDWCRKLMPQYKVPHHLRILPSLPCKASGKVDKLALKGRLSNQA
jgi:long-chain acyl-CoA synthetase